MACQVRHNDYAVVGMGAAVLASIYQRMPIHLNKGSWVVDRWTSICDTLQQVEFMSKFSLQLATGQGASEKRNELHSPFRPVNNLNY